MKMLRYLTCCLLGMTFFSTDANAGSPGDPTYWQDIRPVLRKHCTVCHSAKYLRELDVSGGLALDTFEAIKKGSNKAILHPGKADQSILYQYLVTSDVKKRMPLESRPLPAETIALIKRWIDTGAKEGKAVDVSDPVVGKKSQTARKLDVVITTTATPPAGVFGKLTPGPLELALKIGPLSPVAAVAFSPNDKYLAAGSYGQVAVWDLTQGKPVKILTNVLGAVHDVKFNPAGTLLAVAGGQPSGKGEVRLFQTSDWKLINVLRGHEDVVFSLAFTPDGARLATGSFDHAVCLWDVASQQKLKTYTGHSDFVYAVAFSPDGKKLASAGKDRIVNLVETDTGKSLFTFSGMEEDVMAVAFHPGGKMVVSSGFERGIYWWDATTGERIKVQNGHSQAVHELAFSKDGKKLASVSGDQTVRIWEGTSGALLRTFDVGKSAYSVALSSNGKLIAAGSFNGLVKLWDDANSRWLANFLTTPGPAQQGEWLVLTPEGRGAASPDLQKLARWTMKGQTLPAEQVWSLIQQTESLPRALRGEKVEPLKFTK